MTRYCINCENNKHPIKCAHCEDHDNYRQSKDSKAFEKEVRANERKKVLLELKNGTNGNILIDDTWWNAEYKESTTKNDLEIVIDAMEYRTNSLIENIKSEILHFANAHCSGDDINIYDVFKVIDDCCEAENLTTKNNLSSGLKKNSKKLESGTTKNDLVVDAISRAEVLKIFDEWFATCDIADKKDSPKIKIKALPPVTPIRPKGKWIQQIEEDVDGELLSYWECSKCGRIVGHNMADIKDVINDYPFCHCGADMREVVEE